jgi:hypothetical protein
MSGSTYIPAIKSCNTKPVQMWRSMNEAVNSIFVDVALTYLGGYTTFDIVGSFSGDNVDRALYSHHGKPSMAFTPWYLIR